MFFQRLIIVVCGLRLHCLQTSSEVDICRALWSYTSLANFIKRRSWCAALGFWDCTRFRDVFKRWPRFACVHCLRIWCAFICRQSYTYECTIVYIYIYIYMHPPHLIRNRDFDWESEIFLLFQPPNKKSSKNSGFLFLSLGHPSAFLVLVFGSPLGLLSSCLWVAPRIAQFLSLGHPLDFLVLAFGSPLGFLTLAFGSPLGFLTFFLLFHRLDFLVLLLGYPSDFLVFAYGSILRLFSSCLWVALRI